MAEWTPHLAGLATGARKEVRQLLADVERRGGWIGRRDRAGHIRLKHEGAGAFVSVSSTPRTCGASFRNTEAAIRRAERRTHEDVDR